MQLTLVYQVERVVQVVVEMDMVQQDLLEQGQDLKEQLILVVELEVQHLTVKIVGVAEL